MITFKQFILDESANADFGTLDAKTIARVIFEDCKPFLRESKFDPKNAYSTGLFRGLSRAKFGATRPILKLSAIKNRTPSDSPIQLQQTLDRYFKEKFGYRFRADGTFCSYGEMLARDYGDAYLIFPSGEFQFCYSQTIGDAFSFFDNRINDEEPEGLEEMSKHLGQRLEDPYLYNKEQAMPYPEWLEIVDAYLDHANPYTVQNLRAAQHKPHVGSHAEIMLGCESYYALYYPSTPSDNPATEKQSEVLAELSKLL